MSVLDNVLQQLPYTNILGGDNQKDLNKQFEIFSDASLTKDEKIQRISVVNKFDQEMTSTHQGGMWINSLSELIFSSDSNDKARRIEGARQMSGFPEVTDALREICDEFLTKDENGKYIQFALRGDYNEEVKGVVEDEFYKFLEVFDFDSFGWDYMRDFLIEGEAVWENIVSVQRPELGIIGLTKISPDRIDPFYYDVDNELIQVFVLRKKMLDNVGRARHYSAGTASNLDKKNQILFLNEKQITYAHSGVWDDSGKKKYRKPHLENASRPYRQLALIEDATIIYMLVRAPERLVFNIDTGHLPPGQAESYVKKQMAEFWNRKGVGRDGRVENTYDPQTMLENYYFAKPRGSDGSSVTSIGGGSASPDNLEILTLFINRLYKSLGVPLARLNSETAFSDGMDVTREELRFAKFIIRLQKRFAEAVKSSFIAHLKIKGRKLTKQATGAGITTIPEGKEFYDFSDWNNYDKLVTEVKIHNTAKIKHHVEEIEKCKEKLYHMKHELDHINGLIVEQDIKSERTRLITEEYSVTMRNIQVHQANISHTREEEESLWSQYELREETLDIEFNKPTQFFALKEQQLWQLKFESYSSLSQDDLVSTTFAQKTHLGWDDEQVMANREHLRKDAAFRWELAQIETAGPDFREAMAGAAEGDELGGMGGMGDLGEGGLGDDMGGLGPDSDTALPEFGDTPSDEEITGLAGVDEEPPAAPPDEEPPA